MKHNKVNIFAITFIINIIIESNRNQNRKSNRNQNRK